MVSFRELVGMPGAGKRRQRTVLIDDEPLKACVIMERACREGQVPPDQVPPNQAPPNDVLIVEDDPIIALDFEDTILGFGVKMVRSAASVTTALEMIAERTPDFALLDVSLMREKSFEIAEKLDALNIPFVFVTGHGANVELPSVFADRPRLGKPCTAEALEAMLRRAG